ncbi:MAG: hypothetical protein JW940_16280 [Polyangiaceae bacterium]|nr:hypothetical protein [Polyangiaceae bacterium]
MKCQHLSRNTFLWLAAFLGPVVACGASGSDSSGGAGTTASGSGGTPSTGGASGGRASAGGTNGSGGSLTSGGSVASSGAATSPGGTGGAGGAVSSGGSLTKSGGATSAPTGGITGRGGGGGATGSTGGVSGGAGSGGGGGRTEASGGEDTRSGGTSAGGTAAGGTSGGSGASGATGASGGASGTGGSSGSGGGTNVLGPCDIYEAGDTPCVGAHSTVRALYGAYDGKLYQVRRADNTTRDIGVLTRGGVADAAEQEAFCAGTQCTLSIIYDQSPQHNDLTRTTGGWIGDFAKEADAAGIQITLNGHTVYGVHIPLLEGLNGTGYRNNEATGTAEGDEPESMYMVVNGRAFSDECCFDYGNAERNSLNNGRATMEAIYFGNCTAWGSGEGSGPWVMADLEEGLFSGQGPRVNTANTSLDFDYVTATLKGQPHQWAIKAGDSQSGGLTKMYEGPYPNGYDPMKKEGAIVLGTGGDNSYKGVGDFFEGAMTTGYASDATEDAVQANVVAAGYGR